MVTGSQKIELEQKILNTERVIDQQDELSGYRKAEKINRAMQNGNSELKKYNRF